MRKIFISCFALMLVVLVSAFAAADLNLNIMSVTPSFSTTHGSSVTGTFTINNTNTTTAMTNLNCAISAVGFTPSSSSCSLPSSVSNMSTSGGSFTFTVPQFTFANPSYSGTLTLTGNLSGVTATSNTAQFTVSVASSPSLTVTWLTSPVSIYQGQSQQASFTIFNNGNVNFDTVNASADLSSMGLGIWSSSLGAMLANSTSASRNISLNASTSTDVKSYSVPLRVFGIVNSNSSLSISTSSSPSFSVLYPYCDNVSNMSGSPISFEDIKNQQDIDNEDFNPLDEVNVKLKVRNNHDSDSQYAVAEIVLVQGNSEVDDTHMKKKAKIKDHDYMNFELNFTIPADIEEGKAYLYIKVYNDDEDTNCQQRVLTLNIKKNARELLPYAIEYPLSVTCGGTFTFSGKLANIGEEDEEKVKVIVNAFGQKFTEDYSNVDSGDITSLFTHDFSVPANATEGSSTVTFTAYYDYNEDDENFDESEAHNYVVTVSGCKKEYVSIKTETSTAISLTESEVRFLVSNPSSSSQTYTASATADWATVNSLSPQTFTLEAGKQQYVSVKLTPNKDASIGLHNLEAKIAYGSKTESVNVPVNVQKASVSSGLLDQIAFQFKYNTTWAVIDTVLGLAIIVILVLLFMGKRK